MSREEVEEANEEDLSKSNDKPNIQNAQPKKIEKTNTEDVPKMKIEFDPKIGQQKKVYLTSRCGVDQFCDLIGNFCEVKKKLIEDMGFGELLYLKKHMLKMQLLEDLLMRFDASTSELFVHGHTLTFGIDDVINILGVHVEGDDVETQFGDIDDEVRVRYNLGNERIKCLDLQKNMVNITNDDEFRGKFLLYVICRLLRPSTALHVPNSYLKLLRNIENVRHLNWAKFVYEGILEGVRCYLTKDEIAPRERYVTGCILALEIFYLEHVNIVNVMPRRQKHLLPHIQNWDECSILKLLQNIKNLGGVDSSQVRVEKDVASKSCTIEDVHGQMVNLRCELKEEISSCSKQLSEFKNEMLDSMSKMMSTLSSLQCQLQREAANKSTKKDYEYVHVSEVHENDSSDLRFKNVMLPPASICNDGVT